MNRHVRVFLGWPSGLLGKIQRKGSSPSAVNENYAVVCYERETPEHGFLVANESSVGEVTKMWLMGESADAIHEKVISV